MPRIRDVCGASDLDGNRSGREFASGLSKTVQRELHVAGKTVNFAYGTLLCLRDGKSPESHKDLGGVCMTCSLIGHGGSLHK